MNCEHAERLTADFLADELGPAQGRALKSHLAECPACRARFSALSGTRDAIRGLAPTQTNAELAVSHLAIEFSNATPVRPNTGLRPRLNRLRMHTWTSLRVAATMFIAFGVGYLTHAWSSPDGTVPNAREHSATPPPVGSYRFEDRLAASARRFPRQSSLTWSLLSVARR